MLQAAIALADDGGIDSLSMRKLARALGVEAMSLYNHVADKSDLVAAITDLALEEIELPTASTDWEAAIRTGAVSAHAMFLRHPWACSLVVSPNPASGLFPARVRYMEWLLGCLREAGLSPEVTYYAYHALDSHIVGFTLWQLGHLATARDLARLRDMGDFVARLFQALEATNSRHVREHLAQHQNAADDEGGRSFEFGLNLILEGLKRMLENGAGD